MVQALWPNLQGRRILLGLGGGIAAYKSAELCRLLVRCGADVQVIMTDAAKRFVGEATFSALTGKAVRSALFDDKAEAEIGHIRLADEADLLLLAPATASRLAKCANGLADDLLATVHLAYRGPVLVAPAMNPNMWQHPATQVNVERLRQWGVHFVGPNEGEVACGHQGAGRMAEPEEILQAAGAALATKDLQGKRILVTAGPTREPIDAVRYLSNPSTGKMGYALALEAQARGAKVVLVSGPTQLACPGGVQRIGVNTAAQMWEAVQGAIADQHVAICCAAVGDFRPRDAAVGKTKKEDLAKSPTLELEGTVDILAALGQQKKRPLLVGFAAETSADLDELATAKLKRKGCDLLVANNVAASDAGFEVDTNRAVFYQRNGASENHPLLYKRALAGKILDWVVGALS